jgi:rSAM/selenodomain-associated transferase 1
MLPKSASLLVFVKEPVPGSVKTRLAATLGMDGAAALYRELVDATLQLALDAQRAGIVAAVELWCTPSADAPYFRNCAQRADASLHTQCAGDLGARMAYALGDARTRNPIAVLIGSDCPALTPVMLAAAVAHLADDEAVIGPAEDGGFVLFGARTPLALDGVRWSSAHALADTRAALAGQQVRWSELPVSWDVDEPADVARWRALRARADRGDADSGSPLPARDTRR